MVHKLTQFLLINAETFESNGVKGKLPLVYFFFKYAHVYSKEHYSEFAFEILEDILVHELFIIENGSKEECTEITGIGWVLIQFIYNGYFESDDLDDILSIMDKAIFREVERLSRTDFEVNFLVQLISSGLYLKSRTDLLKNDETKFLEAKEHLLISFFELSLNLPNIPKEKIELYGLCLSFLKDSFNHEMVSHFCKEGIKKLNELNSKKHNDLIVRNYETLLEDKRFEAVLAYNLFFPETIKKNKADLIKSIENYVDKLMEDLYKNNDQKQKSILQQLLICAITMINNFNNIKTNSLEFYMIGLLINSIADE
ncbi:hypothetical protein [Snuella lapsa]|uniref:Uncharacterized protein n=1 Tax=Snuella lapsa TaxID=870481 RepID=A0ABP6XN48_9FLAO